MSQTPSGPGGSQTPSPTPNHNLDHAGQPIDASLYLHPQTLARLGSFELRAKLIVEGVMSGQHRSPYQGFSVEFAQHRPYSPGDDLRHLDWKVYARTDRLQIKQYQQETNLDLVVLVDTSGSMKFGTRSFKEASGIGQDKSPSGLTEWTKFDHATALAAAVAYVTLHQGDRVGMVTFADEVRSMVPRSSQRGTWRKIVETLSTETVDRPTSFGRVIDQVIAKLNNRCLLVVISDFLEDAAAIRQSLGRVKHRGHDMIAFQVLDQAERDFPFLDAARFEGLEGESAIRVDPAGLRDAYLAEIEAHIGALKKACLGFNFDHEDVSTHDWLGPPLAAFVARRHAMMKRTKYG